MKVLMFGWEFPPHITGGLGTACYGLTKGLTRHNAEVVFVVPKSFGDEDQSYISLVNASDVEIDIREKQFTEFVDRLTYLEIGSNLIPYVTPEEFQTFREKETKTTSEDTTSLFTGRYQFSGKYGSNLFEEVSRYALIGSGLARVHSFDIIHAHDWLTYPAGIAAKQASGKPLVVHMHATEFDRSGENINQLVYDIEKAGMEAADRVITVSNFTRQIVIDRYGIDPNKIFTVHNAVEPTETGEKAQFDRTVDEKIVTFLGRLTYQKGPEYFIEAAHKILQRDENVRFVMAGTGDMLEKMVKRVAQLKMSTKFHFTGFLKGPDVDRMFALSDVFVMPSVSEPFGIVPLEAMRSNVPVVISKQSGVSEILKHALKIDFWDVEGLADAIYGILHYDALRRMFLKHGKEEVDSLKWENAAFNVIEVYNSVLKQMN